MIGGLSPSQHRSLGTHTEGWCLKSRHIAGVIYDSLFFWCKGWLMSNEGLGRLRGQEEGAGWVHLVGKGLVPPAATGVRPPQLPPSAWGQAMGTAVGWAGWQDIPTPKLSQNPPGSQ